ncbi:Neuronal growth regulator 1, partial [Biomphalaria glabrata]
VVWMRGAKILTLEDRRIVSDERVSLERPFVKEWNLHIRKIETVDSGLYMCQINTDPLQVRSVTLVVH